MNDDERRVQSILAFTFKKLDEELVRPGPAKKNPAKGAEQEQPEQEQPVEGRDRRRIGWG